MRFRVAESESQLYRDTDLGPMHGAFSAIAERLVSVTSLAEQTQTDRNFIQTTGRPDVMLLGGIFLSLLEKKHSSALRKIHSKSIAILYDTRCYFNVRSKADMSQLNLPHGNDN